MGCEKLDQRELAELVVPRSKYSEEAQVLDERWSKVMESVRNIEDRYKRAAVSVLLENQRLMNECATGSENPDELEARKKLIKLVSVVFPNLLAWNLISMQPMLGPTSLCYYFRYRISDINKEKMLAIDSEDMVAKTRKLERRICSDFGPNDVSYDIINDFDTEILRDLWNNCATVGCVNLKPYKTDKAPRLQEALEGVVSDASKRLGHKDGSIKPNWMVVNEGLYKRVRGAFDLWNGFSIYPHKGVSGVLIGRKGESYMDSGYVYAPYVPFTITPTLDNRHSLLTRYGKKLLREGSTYYARVNVIDDEPEEG